MGAGSGALRAVNLSLTDAASTLGWDTADGEKMAFQFVGMAFLAIAASVCVSVAVLWLMDRRAARHHTDDGRPRQGAGLTFLFDGDALVDASDAAQVLLAMSGQSALGLRGVLFLLSSRFPDLSDQTEHLGPCEQRSIYSADRSEIATLCRRNGRLRLALTEIETADPPTLIDRPSLLSLEREVSALRGTTENMPFLVWRQDGAGNISWVNRAYAQACTVYGTPPRDGLWPPCRLFDIDLAQVMPSRGTAPQRLRLGGEDGQPATWYQFHITRLDDDDFLISGMNVDTVVEAEDSLRTFVQTLSKTFADLPIGLAVFTRDRRMALFNPALVDLTGIAPERLIQRPSLFGFFDMLRETQMMPEPKNYASWRDQIVDLEASAANGTYLETWHLPFGRTFRVTGRPQIDGAVALLFEDISDEMGLSRRFRTELEIGQSVLDSLDVGVAVFSSGGVLTLTNATYDALWHTDTREGLDTLFITDATRHWSQMCVPGPAWDEMRDFVLATGRKPPVSLSAMLSDGRPLFCALRAVSGGATLISFQIQTTVARPVHEVPREPPEHPIALKS